ncbi:serine protease [Aeromonas dhakensis]|uniref:trypsin-like serine peptidase n=1 Tax=Aeromonas dhakensis TaxID=196024 RepID=UPI003F83195D
MDLSKFENQMFFTTIRITIPIDDGASSSIGTGFLFNTPLENNDLTGVFLVSNKHVFGDPNRRIILNFHQKIENEDKPELGIVKSIVIENFSGHYYEHPDKDIDLACINVSAYVGAENGVYSKHLHSEFFHEADLSSVLPGSEVLFVGYPDNRFDSVHNLPILRKGTLATLPTINFNGLKQIIIDAQVFPGSSGSPVFVVENGKYKLLGVITATMIKHELLKTIQVSSSYAVQQTIGLGIVLKTELVKELLDIAKHGLSERISNTNKKN